MALGVAGWFATDFLRQPDDEGAGAVASEYLRAWEGSEWSLMEALLIDAPSDFAERHEEMFASLGVEGARFVLTDTQHDGDSATANFEARLALAGLGEWVYSGTLALVREGGSWLVDWSSAAFHPSLGEGQRLEVTRSWPERAPIRARGGRALVKPREVIAVGVEPRRIEHRRRMLRQLERLVAADPERVAADLDAPGVQPDWFVPVTVLRPERYEQVRPKLYPVPGVVFRRELARLSPAEGFARHVLGGTGEITAEQLEELGDPYLQGDTVGTFGLERVFERKLAGRPSGEVRMVDESGKLIEVLERFPGEEAKPLRTTLDLEVQSAAEAALAGVTEPAAIVAIDWQTGAIRAVASRPLDEFNRALAGAYPPGSAFKIVSSAALLTAGVSPGDIVECAPETIVGGRTFRNAEGTPSGAIPFSQAFAVSCNTAFVELVAGLESGVLEDAADRFGFGAAYELPLPVAGGRFPTPVDDAEQAAAGIGQGRVEASPLHLATVAAAAASGVWRPPHLLKGERSDEERQLVPGLSDLLRELMRAVVLQGTGTAADVPGARVFGKTGTAEFGEDDPPESHAWFVGFHRKLAFAVLVEGGGAGGAVAAPIAARFVKELGR